uniref:Small ribosomal subunit protein bS16c n=1 Tax=Lophocladia kuetzingii TaxID=675577 RepID=A0A1Z1MNX4_9FLOR|nr:ribosomal protein S16 [Lophocladia kuetzingii]ARW67758.1 ribosomal protein S16 [Lophocladia kuetzingii]
MLKIRLKKVGRKKKACYRIILIDSRKKRDGKAIEKLGFYNPLTKQYKVDIIKVKQKITEGAKLTKTVENLINKNYKS